MKKASFILKLISFFIILWSGFSQSAPTTENRIKAIIVYKISRFTSWPNKEKDLNICTIASKNFNQAMQKVISSLKQINKTKLIEVEENKIKENQCNILYMESGKVKDPSLIINKVNSYSILTISDIKGFAKSGGVIELYKEKNKVKFSINITQKEKSNLIISSKLLTLAKIVK